MMISEQTSQKTTSNEPTVWIKQKNKIIDVDLSIEVTPRLLNWRPYGFKRPRG